MKISILAINTSLALIAGISIGLLLGQDKTPTDKVTQKPMTTTTHSITQFDTSSPLVEINRLENLLADETLARQIMQSELDELKALVEALDQTIKASSQQETSQATQQPVGNRSRPQVFNSQALVDVGMTSDEASELKNFYERQELERLQIRDQSIRESWSREQFRDAVQALQHNNADVLDTLNDNEYDAFLYATGQPNRVEVTSVLDSSQAQLTGLQAGDQIIRYDGNRVYGWNELRSATSQGELGEQVLLQVDRNGELIDYYVDRGPLGIRMNSISQKP